MIIRRGFAQNKLWNEFEEIEKPWIATERENRASYFAVESHLADAALIVENRQIWISRQMLAWFSPAFERLFFGQNGFSRESSMNLPPFFYPIEDKKFTDVLELITVLFPCPVVKEIEWRNVGVLLELSTEYDVSSVKIRCEKFLKTQLEILERANGQGATYKTHKKNEMNLFRIFSMAAKFKLTKLLMKSSPLIARLSDSVIKEKRKNLDPKCLAALYQAKLNKTRLCFVIHKFTGPVVYNNPFAACAYCKIESTRLCTCCNRFVCKNCMQQQPCRCKFCSKPFRNIQMTDCSCGYQFDLTLFRD